MVYRAVVDTWIAKMLSEKLKAVLVNAGFRNAASLAGSPSTLIHRDSAAVLLHRGPATVKLAVEGGPDARTSLLVVESDSLDVDSLIALVSRLVMRDFFNQVVDVLPAMYRYPGRLEAEAVLVASGLGNREGEDGVRQGIGRGG